MTESCSRCRDFSLDLDLDPDPDPNSGKMKEVDLAVFEDAANLDREEDPLGEGV